MGAVDWVVHIGGTEIDTSSSVALDPEGGVIVVGFFYKHCNFSGTTLPDVERFTANPASRDMYTTKVRRRGRPSARK